MSALSKEWLITNKQSFYEHAKSYQDYGLLYSASQLL
jgi:hypothetical protein